MKLILLLSLLLTLPLWAQRKKVDPISFGNVTLGEDRMPLVVSSFLIKNTGKIFVKAGLIEHSLQWVRVDDVLLVPRALLTVTFRDVPLQNYSFSYGNLKVIPVYDDSTGTYKTTMFISLFEALPVELMLDNEVVSKVWVLPTPESSPTHELVDYSCAPYGIKISGVENDFISLGCKIQRTGKFGQEKPYLEVLFTLASYRLKDQSIPPYTITFYESGTAKIKLVRDDGKETNMAISAEVPEHLPRLKIAGGFGPYTLYTKTMGDRLNQYAPTLMLYGNLGLNDKSSLRAFDSYSRDVSTFHNYGVYLAWDLARFCDERCQLTSLLGAQGVDYRFNANDDFSHDLIYPQGFEFVYSHPFGLLNYKLSYGMFTSLSGLYDYQNLWLRFGKKIFWELNYIEWKDDHNSANMFGISIGLPLASFF